MATVLSLVFHLYIEWTLKKVICSLANIFKEIQRTTLIMENWTRSETLVLIAEYKKHQILYNPSHPDHNKYNKRQIAYQYIADALQDVKPGISADAVKKKFRVLNRQMSYEQNKMSMAQRDGRTELYKPSLWCFMPLSFLLKPNAEKESTEKSNSQPEKVVDLNNQEEAESPIQPKQRKLERDSSVSMLENCAKKSMQLMAALLEKNKTQHSKEDLFCSMLSAELSEINQEDVYDGITMEILNVVRRAKEKERVLFERQQIAKEILQSPHPDDNIPQQNKSNGRRYRNNDACNNI